MIPCQICGVPVIDGSRHLTWHLKNGDLETINIVDPCPLDGMPLATANTKPDGSGSAIFACGHGVVWPAPHVETDEDRHGPWNKNWERYEDGCRYDQPH